MSNLAFYHKHYAALLDPLLQLSLTGIAIDPKLAAEKREELAAKCDHLIDQLDELIGVYSCVCGHGYLNHGFVPAPVALTKAGKPKKRQPPPTRPCTSCTACTNFAPAQQSLRAEKDLASPRVITFLYSTLGFPKQYKKESVTADEIACRKLLLRAKEWQLHPKKQRLPLKRWQLEPAFAIAVIDLILQHREAMKQTGYLDPANIDEDNRLRCQYKVTTEPGRLASKSNPFNTGYNLQNIPRGDMRRVFVPDPGMVLWSVDYSQAEYRIVKVLSKDAEAIRQARLRPTEFDAYSAKAQYIFSKLLRCREDEIDVKAEVVPGTSRRQVTKPLILGIGYGEGAKKIQDQLLKDGVVLPLDTIEFLLNAAREQYVLDYQRERRKRVMRTGVLVSSWGRILDLRDQRLDDRTYRRAYAWCGATENGDNLNQLGLIPLVRFIVRERLRSICSLQVHDELVGSSPPNELYDLLAFLVESMEQERDYEGVKLAIPVGMKIGSSWKCEFEWKALPDRKTIEEAARECLARSEERMAA